MQPPVNHHNLNINHLEEDTGAHQAMKHGVYGNCDLKVKFDHPVEVVVKKKGYNQDLHIPVTLQRHGGRGQSHQ